MVRYTTGAIFYSRKHDPKYFMPSNFRGLEWFRPHLPEADSYGTYLGTYVAARTLNLLNLGDATARRDILKYTCLTPCEFDPDEQYSCHSSNLRVHEAIMASHAFRCYDGTIISEALTDACLEDDLAGPEEIVLFMNRVRNALILDSVSSYFKRVFFLYEF